MGGLGKCQNARMAAPLAVMRRWRRGNSARLHRLPAFLHRGWFVALVLIVALAIGFRIALPIMLTHYSNRVLNGIPGYEGHIADVDVHLWRGAYAIHRLDIVKVDVAPKTGKVKRSPFLYAETIDLSIEWGELVRGAVVGQIEFDRPTLNLYAGPARKEQTAAGDDFISRFRRLLPMQINRFAVVDGELHFRNYAAEPDVDIYLDRINLVARNLTNSTKISDTLVATVSGDARAMKSGDMRLEMKLDPFAPHPTYDLALELKNLHLPELNNYLRHYLAVVARDGRLSLYAESAAKDGRFKGYVKPIVKDLDVLKIKQKKTFGEAVKAFFVKIMAGVFENKPKEQLATKIDFSGNFKNPKISVWDAVTEFMRNAFEALPPGLEGSVSPEEVGIKRADDAQSQQKQRKEERKTREEREEIGGKR